MGCPEFHRFQNPKKREGTAGSDPTGSRGKRWNRGFGSNRFSRKALELGSDSNPVALLVQWLKGNMGKYCNGIEV